jgi:outer membrane autotransporter protein
VASSATYHIDLANNWFAEPSVGFGATLSEFGTLQTNANQQSLGIVSGAISFDSINSLLARAGVRVGTTVPLSQTLVVQPFGTFSTWHEFDDNSRSVFTQPGFADPVGVSRVGTFYQAGVGMSGQIVNTGWLGFVRGDFRWGERIDGTSIIGGLRYNFTQ